MHVSHDVPLAPKTTLGLGGPARHLVRVDRADDIAEALALANDQSVPRPSGRGTETPDSVEPVLILGGGSNLVVRDGGFAGLVVQMAIPGVSIEGDIVTAGAGVVWDDFVAHVIDDGRTGVECLSGIPGLVGATPMQNVGAYGQEVADTITAVRVFDRTTGRLEVMAPATCNFAYRTSVFKGSDRWIVVEVAFRLARGTNSAPIRYPELARALGVAENGCAPLGDVRRTVIELRRGKGMVVDPKDPESKSAGSFFTNPIVDTTVIAPLEARFPAMPKWPAGDGKTKLSAGWLIERAGFTRGYAKGRARISNKHALALVNSGDATTAELLGLAAEIQAGVRERLGIELVPEPIIVGSD